MVYLNFTHLDGETQQKLIEMSRKDVEDTRGKELERYAKRNGYKYETLLEEEAQRNLYSYDYVFNI